MILPFNALCPKCKRTGLAKRYEPKITEEAYQRALKRFEDDLENPFPWRDFPRGPHEEHLVRECECRYVFWTRTADYQHPASNWHLFLEAVEDSDIDRAIEALHALDEQNGICFWAGNFEIGYTTVIQFHSWLTAARAAMIEVGVHER